MRAILAVALAVAGCADDAVAPDLREAIVPGERVGAIELGMTWGELVAAIGAPPTDPVVLVRIGQARWPGLGLEAVLTSPEDTVLTDDAVVIGAGALAPDDFAIDGELGDAPEAFGGRDYYPAGIAIEHGADGITVDKVAVFAPYVLAPEPPPMQPAATTRRDVAVAAPRSTASVIVDGDDLEVIDMHLHPGDVATMAPTGKAFITANLPASLQIYAPALLDHLSDPWAPHVGIAEQTALAGVDHAVLYAVYTQHTTGYFSNEALEQVLDDPRNDGDGAEPWAWGFASLDVADWTADLAGERLAALRSYFVQRPDRFVGIKLAHAHQRVAFTDPEHQGVYQLAAELGVPVLLHTGFSPFPGASTEPAYYDPLGLEAVVTAFDGAHGSARVDFVLSHVGQGDARAVAHALDLAAAHDNVWLEISALGRPLLVDGDGAPATGTEPQYPAVLAAILERGLAERTLFGSDGPQYSGAIRSYLGRMILGMQDAGFSTEQIAAVLAGNFRRLFLDGDR